MFSAASHDVLVNEAKRLGFAYEDADGIWRLIVNGYTYALNYVGIVYEPQVSAPPDKAKAASPRPNVWGRLRVNGDISGLPSFSDAITQYEYDVRLKGWTSDGKTVAPDWVGNIGIIA